MFELNLNTDPNSLPQTQRSTEYENTQNTDGNRFYINRQQAIHDFDLESKPEKVKENKVIDAVQDLLINAEILIQAKEFSSARHILRQALTLDSKQPLAISKMLQCLGDGEIELQQKITLAKVLVNLEPNFQNYFQYAEYLMRAGQYDSALENYFEANLRVQDENNLLFESFKNIGNIHVRRGDFESAEESYHKAYTLNPDSDVLYVNMGTLAVQKNEWMDALEKFRVALKLNKKNDKAWVGLAISYRSFGDFQMAIGALCNALDISAENRTAIHLYANWCFDADCVSDAILRLQNFLYLNQADVEMSLVLIHLLTHQGRISEARLEIERALCWSPENSDLAAIFDEVESRYKEI